MAFNVAARRNRSATASLCPPAGDALLFLRWSALRDDELGPFEGGSMIPWLDLYAGAKLPTAHHEEGPSARAQARTMGDGTLAAIFGARAIKYVTPEHALRLSARYELHASREVDSSPAFDRFHPGDVIGLALGYLGLSGMHWAFGGTIDLTFTTATSNRPRGEEFQRVPNSAQRELTVGAHVTRTISMPDLDLTLGITYAPPIDGLSKNSSLAGIAAGLTLRWHFMPEDSHDAHANH